MDAFERPLFPGDGDSVYDDACSGRAFAPLALSIRNPETSHYTLKLRTAVGTCATFTSEWPSVLPDADFDGYRALIIKHEQCVSAFRSLWSCFPRVPADSPLHSDVMGAAK